MKTIYLLSSIFHVIGHTTKNAILQNWYQVIKFIYSNPNRLFHCGYKPNVHIFSPFSMMHTPEIYFFCNRCSVITHWVTMACNIIIIMMHHLFCIIWFEVVEIWSVGEQIDLPDMRWPHKMTSDFNYNKFNSSYCCWYHQTSQRMDDFFHCNFGNYCSDEEKKRKRSKKNRADPNCLFWYLSLLPALVKIWTIKILILKEVPTKWSEQKKNIFLTTSTTNQISNGKWYTMHIQRIVFGEQ